MKRLGNIFDKIISVENLVLAEQKARKGKGFQRGIDFVGFRFYHGYTLIRKRIKKNLCRKVAKINHYKRTITDKERKIMIASWIGWCKYSDSKNLQKTLNIYELCK